MELTSGRSIQPEVGNAAGMACASVGVLSCVVRSESFDAETFMRAISVSWRCLYPLQAASRAPHVLETVVDWSLQGVRNLVGGEL